mmetsp:Transcript_120148/g.383577  ORF Transcript_120148/g.383577 Transcript_120148/m.383577 type:complete len:90 (-) Transcript_120148:21-290(-)
MHHSPRVSLSGLQQELLHAKSLPSSIQTFLHAQPFHVTRPSAADAVVPFSTLSSNRRPPRRLSGWLQAPRRAVLQQSAAKSINLDIMAA